VRHPVSSPEPRRVPNLVARGFTLSLLTLRVLT
jgi:hypothetical protein